VYVMLVEFIFVAGTATHPGIAAPEMAQDGPRTQKEQMKLKNKTTDSLALARRIRAAGRPIYIAEDDGEARCIPSDGLLIYQTGGVNESRAIDYSGGTAFIIYLVISINLPNFAISAFGLDLPWKNDFVSWLEDPLQIDGSSRCYRFGGKDIPEFERHHVINNYADVTRILSLGKSLKGFLLGWSLDPIPEQFRHGMMIPAFVVVYDQLFREFRAPVELWADRSRARSRVSRKGGLLDRRDPIVRRQKT
jgi:hypothetical protein